MSRLFFYSPGTCRITHTETTGALPGHTGGTETTEVLAQEAWLWIRPLSNRAQDERFARKRVVVTHEANVDESVAMRIGAVLEYQGKRYPVRGLTPPGPSILMENTGWLLELEEVQ